MMRRLEGRGAVMMRRWALSKGGFFFFFLQKLDLWESTLASGLGNSGCIYQFVERQT